MSLKSAYPLTFDDVSFAAELGWAAALAAIVTIALVEMFA
jgi:hypothetical protein